MKYKIIIGLIFLLTIFSLSFFCIMGQVATLFPKNIMNNQVCYFNSAKQTQFSFQFSPSSLIEFEKYAGISRRVFCNSKEQVLLHIKFTDKKKQYDFLFLDTKNEPCIVKYETRYFKIQRSAKEIRAYIEKLQVSSMEKVR